MIGIFVFAIVQLLSSGYALAKGGMPERATAVMLTLAAALSVGIGKPTGDYQTLDWLQLQIDIILLAGLTVIAGRANRFWPLWVCALQLVAIGVHIVRAHDPSIIPVLYWWLIGKIAYPICFALVLGTWHVQRRTRREGRPPANWSPFRW